MNRYPAEIPDGGDSNSFLLAAARHNPHLPLERPWVVFSLLGVSILVFLLQLVTQSLLGFDLILAVGMKENSLIAAGQLWRLVTPMFLHGSIAHIAFNMYALYNLGQGLERYYGSGRFLVLYFLSGFAGNVISFVFSPSPSVGSSTAIFGLLGAEAVFLYQNRRLFGNVSNRALGQILMIAVINLLIGLSPGIDNWGHLGGLLGGVLFAWFAGPVLELRGDYPFLIMVDGRGRQEVWISGLSVAALFAFLTVAILIMRWG